MTQVWKGIGWKKCLAHRIERRWVDHGWPAWPGEPRFFLERRAGESSMHRIRTFPVAIGLAVVLSLVGSAARAQAPRPPGAEGMPPGPMSGVLRSGIGPESPVGSLLAPAVKRELTLTEEQKTKVYALSRTTFQKSRDITQGVMRGGAANPQAIMRARNRLRQETEQGIGQILDATQRERFDQIILQAESPLAVARPEIAAKLRINETQGEYIQSIMLQLQQSSAR